MASQRAMTAGVFPAGANDRDERAAAAALCPACDEPVHNAALEKYGKYERFAFAAQNPGEKFDVVTFFEVLEHQAAPAEFLRSVKSCLKPRGSIALSVPNRERWLTGPDVLDYPPNHFLRWNVGVLKRFLEMQG